MDTFEACEGMEVLNAEDEKEFSPEFKREAFALLERSSRPLMQVATEVGISPSMLRNRRAAVGGGTGAIEGRTAERLADAVASGPRLAATIMRPWKAFRTLKVELTHQRRWATREDARRDLFVHIESYYNRRQIQSALGCRTPEQAEQQMA